MGPAAISLDLGFDALEEHVSGYGSQRDDPA
jgi:hypothetical protein